jgi:hypothetical protein
MTDPDIVTRLRESEGGYFMRQMVTEAADEIERLRTECDRLARRNTILVTDIETLASAINKATAATAVRTLMYRGEG